MRIIRASWVPTQWSGTALMLKWPLQPAASMMLPASLIMRTCDAVVHLHQLALTMAVAAGGGWATQPAGSRTSRDLCQIFELFLCCATAGAGAGWQTGGCSGWWGCHKLAMMRHLTDSVSPLRTRSAAGAGAGRQAGVAAAAGGTGPVGRRRRRRKQRRGGPGALASSTH